MEILGFEFEDSVFAESRDRSAAKTEAYAAKQCEPQWFRDETSSNDCTEILTAKKFSGDLAYREKDFQKALQEYSSCFLLLPLTNIAMRRDVQESQARCLVHLGRHWEALDISQQLRNGSTNTDHLTTVLNLQFAIYHGMGNVQEVITCLQQLIALHPFNPWHWKTLAEAYLDLLKAVCTSSASKINCQELVDCAKFEQGVDNRSFGLCRNRSADSHCHKAQSSRKHSGLSESSQHCRSSCNSEEVTTQTALCTSSESAKKQLALGSCAEEDMQKLWMNSCASFVRTRLMLQLVQSQQSSFSLENNLKAQLVVEEKLKGFNLNEETLILISEIMGEDLAQERIKDEIQAEGKGGVTAALASFVIASEAEFEGRWFQKMKNNLGRFELCVEQASTSRTDCLTE